MERESTSTLTQSSFLTTRTLYDFFSFLLATYIYVSRRFFAAFRGRSLFRVGKIVWSSVTHPTDRVESSRRRWLQKCFLCKSLRRKKRRELTRFRFASKKEGEKALFSKSTLAVVRWFEYFFLLPKFYFSLGHSPCLPSYSNRFETNTTIKSALASI